MRNFNVVVNGNTYNVSIEETVPSGFSSKNIERTSVDNAVEVQPVERPTVPVVSAPAPSAPAPAPSAPATPVAAPASANSVTSPFPGVILDVRVSVGATVKKGDVLLVVEAMKMENEIMAPSDGAVKEVKVSKGASVDTGEVLVVLG